MVPQNKHIALSAISVVERLLMDNEPLLTGHLRTVKAFFHVRGGESLIQFCAM